MLQAHADVNKLSPVTLMVMLGMPSTPPPLLLSLPSLLIPGMSSLKDSLRPNAQLRLCFVIN